MKLYKLDERRIYKHIPNPLFLDGVAYYNVTEERFVELGGVIVDGGSAVAS